MNNSALLSKGYRFPSEIISHAVWLYYRFSLSFRDVEDLLAKRGIVVSFETIRQWCGKFGPGYAARLKKRQGRLGDTWHLDEVFITIRGQRFLSVHGVIQNLFRVGRHMLHAANARLLRARAFSDWQEVTCV